MEKLIGLFALAALSGSACTADRSSSGRPSHGGGTYPDPVKHVVAVAPFLVGSGAPPLFAPPDEWDIYSGVGFLRDTLGEADLVPIVETRVQHLLRRSTEAIAEINSAYTDSHGGPANCQKIAPSTAVRMPWVTANRQEPFFDFGAIAYQCSIDVSAGSNRAGNLFFGRQAIASPPSVCGDRHRYQLLHGASFVEANTFDVGSRGSTRTVSFAIRSTYDGCTSEVKVMAVINLTYETGLVTAARVEIAGNSATHQFALRALKYDKVMGNSGSLIDGYVTTEGAGVSQTDPGKTDAFIMSYKRFDYASTATTPAVDKIFCVLVDGKKQTAANTGCQAHQASFDALQRLTFAQIPTAPFEAVFGQSP